MPNGAQAQAILEQMLLEFRKENRADHRYIHEELKVLAGQVVAMRLWRARVMGMAAAVAGIISAGAWGMAHALGG